MRVKFRPALTAASLGGAALILAACGQEVAISGASCPTVDAAAFANLPYKVKPNARFEYSSAVFGRSLGHAECEDRRTGFLGFSKYAVCDFTGPAVLEVQYEGAHDYYNLGVGRPVRITVKDGAARCELPRG